ncbi:hypothetical protein [Kocuria flava]|uniref:alpha/beta fold hydrolase n=1 Tax=Kocuria flava TaxID=446860 RepID=UPI002F927F96
MNTVHDLPARPRSGIGRWGRRGAVVVLVAAAGPVTGVVLPRGPVTTAQSVTALLHLEGGPGGTGIGRMRMAGEALEEDFTVAVWDQRGTGTSISALEPTATLTVGQMVADTLAVTDHLRERFGQERIHLVGSS